ncbi:unnamed protein product [Paramecium octaurelia]|uniref:WD domain, G-beta repeat protein n=1 Tax=Paramecium octaurelia TaxID=43137 RepID=A0A8S1TVV8_PAROT|nr:unnamed protein product [Paramecium octaurelia]
MEECLQQVQNQVESIFDNIDAQLDQILKSTSYAIDDNQQNSLQTLISEYSDNFPCHKFENLNFVEQLYQVMQPLITNYMKKKELQDQLSQNEQQTNLQIKEVTEGMVQECENEKSNISMSMEPKLQDQDKGSQTLVENIDANIISIQSSILQSSYLQKMKPYCYQLIQDYSFQQNEICFAIALNKSSSTLVAGCRSQIKLFEFSLNEHKSSVFTLNFMKKSNHFISGSRDGTIIIWQKIQQNLWSKQQILNGHSHQINCLVINNNEDQIISGSDDKAIKIWAKKNEWLCQQTIKDHSKSVYGLSLNSQQNRLISCGFDKFILIREQSELNKEWITVQKLTIEQDGYRICFIDDNTFVFSPYNTEKLQVFEMNDINKQFIQTQDISVKCGLDGQCFFPSQFIDQKQILVFKNGEFINLIRKKSNGEFVTEQSINFETNSFFGSMSDDGEYLITWDNKSNQIQIRKQMEK